MSDKCPHDKDPSKCPDCKSVGAHLSELSDTSSSKCAHGKKLKDCQTCYPLSNK
jgi:hypothetical protein